MACIFFVFVYLEDISENPEEKIKEIIMSFLNLDSEQEVIFLKIPNHT